MKLTAGLIWLGLLGSVELDRAVTLFENTALSLKAVKSAFQPLKEPEPPSTHTLIALSAAIILSLTLLGMRI
jgi:hypothetical protein